MTAEEMAAIHGAAMTVPRPWGVPTFEGFLAFHGAICISEPGGFALGRVVADEAELLTIAVRPDSRRRGIARRCLVGLEANATVAGARRIFLEVAETNEAARALYSDLEYQSVGSRPAYYTTPEGGTLTALLMSKPLIPA